MSTDEAREDGATSDVGMDDERLLALLTGLVRERGRVGAARALGVNYRTLAGSVDSGTLSPRMRRALSEMAESGELPTGSTPEERLDALEPVVEELQDGLRGVSEFVAAQAERLDALERRLANVEKSRAEAGTLETAKDESEPGMWAPPGRGSGFPDRGVVTLDVQLDEEDAFGHALELVREWRRLRTEGPGVGSAVDRARAEQRRWELEVEMIGEFKLTLPPETEPLDESRREDHLGWRRLALERARNEHLRARRLRVLRRVLTLGLWWR